jgi:catechol 2,3-dioxygenase-like lactoylglutathione lyase family enzyme
MPPDIRGLDHIGVMVADLDQASRFLADTLGLEFDREADVPALDVRARFYKCGPATVEVFQPNDPATAAAALGGAAAKLEHIAVRVESLPETLSALGAAGVGFLHPEPVVTGPNLSAYTDPTTSAGMIFQLFAPKPEG